MTREEARQQILEEYPLRDAGALEQDESGAWICLGCGAPALTVDGVKNEWSCASCGRHGNPIDLYALANKCSQEAALEQMAREWGIHLQTREEAVADLYRKLGREWTPSTAEAPTRPPEGPQIHFNAEDVESRDESPETAENEPLIYHEESLEAETVFLTETAEKADEILAAGYPCTALNGAPAISLEPLIRSGKAACYILLFRSVFPEERAARILAGIIMDAGKRSRNLTIQEGETFDDALRREYRDAQKKPDNITRYITDLMRGEIESSGKSIPTGFKCFDKTTGGLYPGLYVLAAISSLGKTTFALQLADQLAAGGQDVVFFSLEQSRLELACKSIARTAYKRKKKTTVDAMTVRSGVVTDEIREAAEAYTAAVGDRISIVEGNMSSTAAGIAEYAKAYRRKTEKKPVVIVDYLQILQPEPGARWKSTKETVDQTVTALKRLSRDLQTPVLVISSVNRSSYTDKIGFESLKETGAIEYTADVVLGMQLQVVSGNDYKAADDAGKKDLIGQEKAKEKRRIDLVILKNRYGLTGGGFKFSYEPKRDTFTEEG